MPSDYESFWEFQTYAVVGHSAKRPFPRLTYSGLKDRRRTVYAVDPSTENIDGDRASPPGSLPGRVDALVVEVPSEETRSWVEQAAAMGVKDVWLHAQTGTPEAVQLARDSGIRLRTGTCAVMYLRHGFTYHSIHRLIRKLGGKY